MGKNAYGIYNKKLAIFENVKDMSKNTYHLKNYNNLFLALSQSSSVSISILSHSLIS